MKPSTSFYRPLLIFGLPGAVLLEHDQLGGRRWHQRRGVGRAPGDLGRSREDEGARRHERAPPSVPPAASPPSPAAASAHPAESRSPRPSRRRAR